MAVCKEIEVYKPPDLKVRLKKEQDILEGYFCPEKYPILQENDYETCFEHKVKLKGDRNYKLRVYVSNSTYPDQLPDLVVCESPEPMPDGLDWSGSHDTHTFPPKCGYLRICHWHWAAWKRENRIYQVFKKGKKWLKAYEKYLVTKELPLELKQMELTEEETQRVQQRHLVQLQQSTAFPMGQSESNFLNQLWLEIWQTFGISREILSQRNLPIFPVTTVDEIRNTQRRLLGGESAIQRVNENPSDAIMLAQLIRLRCALIIEYKAVWPAWLVALLNFLSHRLMMERLASTWSP